MRGSRARVRCTSEPSRSPSRPARPHPSPLQSSRAARLLRRVPERPSGSRRGASAAPQRPPVRPLTACTTHHTNCRLSDGQPFHCLIVGYNTTRVVANAWRSPWHVAGACGVMACWRDGACDGGGSAACGARPAELPGPLLRQGRQGRTSGVLARICHGSEMFVSTPYL